MTKMTIG